MRATVPAHPVDVEAFPFEEGDQAGERLGLGANVRDSVTVLAGLDRFTIVLKGEKQHHLPSDQHPRQPAGSAELEKYLPQLIDWLAERRESHTGSIHLLPVRSSSV
jgi:hypothetical protein